MTQRPGFALTLALSCLALILLTTLATQAFLTVEMRAMSVQVSAARRRQDLQQATLLSLASLQASVGKDMAHTFRRGEADWAAAPGLAAEPLSGSVTDPGWAWVVRDLSQFHDSGAERRAAMKADAWTSGARGRGKVPLRIPDASPEADERASLELGWPLGVAKLRGAGSRGVLTDPTRGGFRTDLSEERNLESRLGHDVHRAWSGLVSGVDPMIGMEIGRPGVPCPLLAGVTLSLGVFNSRADGRHRVRFHASGIMWNDLGVPLSSPARGRMILVELKGAPTITIRNLDSGAEVVADLDEAVELDLGALEQGRRERTLWFMAGVDDPALPPTSSSGLLAGETYAFISPSPATQPQGLARILSAVTWRMDRRTHGPGWRRPAPEVMTPSDRIAISFRFEGESSLVIRRHAGDPAKDAGLESYPGEACQVITGLRFESFVIETTGEEYSRPDSSGYVISERRACMDVFLDVSSADEFVRWRSDARSMLSRSWSSRHPLAFGRPEEDFQRRPGQVLWDETPNAHGSGDQFRFGRAVGPEIPLRPMLSPASLRHLGHVRWVQALDSAAFLPRPGVPSHPRVRTWKDGSAASAQDFFIDGTFNVNATDPREWEALLWSAGASPFSSSAAAFPSRPSTVDVPLAGLTEPRALEDAEIDGLAPAVFAEAVHSQPVRLLSRGQIESLACALAADIARSGPFPSLAAFHESGALERAMTKADLNGRMEGAHDGLPFRLTADDIMELFGPQLAVRGDTFEVNVTVRGNPASAAVCLVVQRMPDPEGLPGHLGRRLKVLTVSYP